MTKTRTLQILRGTTAQNEAYTGSAGELTMDTTLNQLRLHDGTTVGGKVIEGGYHPDLFTWQWADHELNDVQWLRADTFSWQSGAVYEAGYQHLVDDTGGVTSLTITNGTTLTFDRDSSLDGTGYYGWRNGAMEAYTASDMPDIGTRIYYSTSLTGAYDTIESVSYNVTPQTETIAGITITYFLADDGHKICLADQESNVAAIYAATGVAWYYILDTANQRFKLPRTKWGITGLRDAVGKYVEQDVLLPNITGSIGPAESQNNVTGAFYTGDSRSGYYHRANTGTARDINFDASRSSSVYSGNGTDTLIQPRTTQMYLYFYVGSFTQTAIENTAGLNAELFNDKADAGLSNTPMATADYVIEWQNPSAENNYTWYKKYKSRRVEQGGITGVVNGVGATASVTLPVEMSDANYSVYVTITRGNPDYRDQFLVAGNRSVTGFTVYSNWAGSANGTQDNRAQWMVCGMAAN